MDTTFQPNKQVATMTTRELLLDILQMAKHMLAQIEESIRMNKESNARTENILSNPIQENQDVKKIS